MLLFSTSSKLPLSVGSVPLDVVKLIVSECSSEVKLTLCHVSVCLKQLRVPH